MMSSSYNSVWYHMMSVHLVQTNSTSYSQPTFPVEGVVHSVPWSECCRGRRVARGQAGVHEGQEGGAGIYPIRSGGKIQTNS